MGRRLYAEWKKTVFFFFGTLPDSLSIMTGRSWKDCITVSPRSATTPHDVSPEWLPGLSYLVLTGFYL